MNAHLSQAKWEDVKTEIRQLLIDTARARTVIAYSELTAMLQTARVHYHSHILARLLVDIGWEETEAGRPVLPALVVTRQSGMPGQGFFKLAAERGYDISQPDQYWAAAVQQVHDYWSKH
jgi:hypothetical protein